MNPHPLAAYVLLTTTEHPRRSADADLASYRRRRTGRTRRRRGPRDN